MTFNGLSSPQDRADVMLFLNEHGGTLTVPPPPAAAPAAGNEAAGNEAGANASAGNAAEGNAAAPAAQRGGAGARGAGALSREAAVDVPHGGQDRLRLCAEVMHRLEIRSASTAAAMSGACFASARSAFLRIPRR